jgi:hypothetical protein
LEVGLRRVHLGLHLTVGVVDDGQEHVLEVSKRSIQQRKGKWKAKVNLETLIFSPFPKVAVKQRWWDRLKGWLDWLQYDLNFFINKAIKLIDSLIARTEN